MGYTLKEYWEIEENEEIGWKSGQFEYADNEFKSELEAIRFIEDEIKPVVSEASKWSEVRYRIIKKYKFEWD